jgi:hypothetical protein
VAPTSSGNSGRLADESGDVFIDGATLLFTDPGGNAVYATPLAGGALVRLASGQAGPIRVVGDGTYAYWSSYEGGAILRAPEDGTASFEVVAPANAPIGLAVDDTYVYWADTGSGTLLRAPKTGVDGGSPVTLASESFGNLAGSLAPDFTLVNGSLYLGSLSGTYGQGPLYTFATPNGPMTQVPAPVGVSPPPTDVTLCAAPVAVYGDVIACAISDANYTDPGWYVPGTSVTYYAEASKFAYNLYGWPTGVNMVFDQSGCGTFTPYYYNNTYNSLAPDNELAFWPKSPAVIPLPVGYFGENLTGDYQPSRQALSGTTLVLSMWASPGFGRDGGVAYPVGIYKLRVPN